MQDWLWNRCPPLHFGRPCVVSMEWKYFQSSTTQPRSSPISYLSHLAEGIKQSLGKSSLLWWTSRGLVWGNKQWGTERETKCAYLEVAFYSAPVLGDREKEVRGNAPLPWMAWEHLFLCREEKSSYRAFCSDLPWTLHELRVHHTNTLYIHVYIHIFNTLALSSPISKLLKYNR